MKLIWLGAVLVALATAACGDSSRKVVASGGDDTTTEVTTTTVEDATTSSGPPPSTTAPPRRRTTTSGQPPAAPTTAVRVLELRKIQVGAGAPCQKTQPTDADGCFFFVQIPNTQQHISNRLHSDRGYDAELGAWSCNQGATRPQDTQSCEAYVGPVYDRQPGDNECFWLTTTDPAYENRSSNVCIVWPQRP